MKRFARLFEELDSTTRTGDKVRAMARKGPAGILRLAKNGARIITGRWERPARADWWRRELADAGFVDVRVDVLGHEGGIAIARTPRPTPTAPTRRTGPTHSRS